MVGSESDTYEYCSEELTFTIFGEAKSNTDTQREMAQNEEETKMNFIRGWILVGL